MSVEWWSIGGICPPPPPGDMAFGEAAAIAAISSCDALDGHKTHTVCERDAMNVVRVLCTKSEKWAVCGKRGREECEMMRLDSITEIVMQLDEETFKSCDKFILLMEKQSTQSTYQPTRTTKAPASLFFVKGEEMITISSSHKQTKDNN